MKIYKHFKNYFIFYYSHTWMNKNAKLTKTFIKLNTGAAWCRRAGTRGCRKRAVNWIIRRMSATRSTWAGRCFLPSGSTATSGLFEIQCYTEFVLNIYLVVHQWKFKNGYEPLKNHCLSLFWWFITTFLFLFSRIRKKLSNFQYKKR